MSAKAQPIPPGYDSVIPYLVIKGAAKALDYYKELFGAEEILRMTYPGGTGVAHAEMKIRSAVFMLGDEAPDFGAVSPQTLKGSAVSIMLYMPDVDATFAKAAAMGVKVMMPPADMFWGDRMCKFADPFGHIWAVATHIEDVSPEECLRRGEAAFSKRPCT